MAAWRWRLRFKLMSDLDNLVEETVRRVRVALGAARRPAVLWSGGKDSSVLLHVALGVAPELEVIQWRLPWLREKWIFHERLAAEWGVTLHDQLPAWSGLCHGNDRIDIMEGYQMGAGSIVVARGTTPLDLDAPWVCGLDWLARPKAGMTDFPWDVLLHGHKGGDVDPLSGAVPLELDVLRPVGCPEIHFPMRMWSDRDIGRYIAREGIDYDSGRYEPSADGELISRENKELNSDYYNACLRCIDKREGAFVECPKRRLVVENISARCQEYVPRHGYCNLRCDNASLGGEAGRGK